MTAKSASIVRSHMFPLTESEACDLTFWSGTSMAWTAVARAVVRPGGGMPSPPPLLRRAVVRPGGCSFPPSPLLRRVVLRFGGGV